jgi:epoxyqueuosine reductase
MSQMPDPNQLADAIRSEATRLGFDLVGIAPAVSPAGFDHLQEWLRRGYAGEMSYMPRREEAYEHPSGVLPEVRSLIVVGLNYFDADYKSGQNETTSESNGRVARYAVGRGDYHDVLKTRLKQLGQFLQDELPECRTRSVVDTAPLLERDFAVLAGLGWFGKNTMLINKHIGSWFFLGALLTDAELTPDAPHATSHCGTCTRCLDACPTDAFPEPGVLDARRCISYLTIELRDQPIPEDLREGMGNWVFGCDICQDVCPWNRKAPPSTVDDFKPLADLTPADLRWLLSLDEDGFRQRFRGTPQFRTGRSGLLRNAAIAAGNSGDRSLIPALTQVAADPEELIRDAAAWALGRLGDSAVEATLTQPQLS